MKGGEGKREKGKEGDAYRVPQYASLLEGPWCGFLRHSRAKAALQAVSAFYGLLNYTGAADRVWTSRRV